MSSTPLATNKVAEDKLGDLRLFQLCLLGVISFPHVHLKLLVNIHVLVSDPKAKIRIELGEIKYG